MRTVPTNCGNHRLPAGTPAITADELRGVKVAAPAFIVGDRVCYHGDGPLWDEHFRVVANLPHGHEMENGNRYIGTRVLVDDGAGCQYAIPPAFLHLYEGRCVCDACC